MREVLRGQPMQPGNSVLLGGSRLLNRQSRDVATQTGVGFMKINGRFAAGDLAMNRSMKLDEERHRLAGGDPTRNEILAEIELAVVGGMVNDITTMYY